MEWLPLAFNLVVALLFASYLLLAERRFERRADAVLATIDRLAQAHREEVATERRHQPTKKATAIPIVS